MTNIRYGNFRRAKDFCLARICGGIVAIFIVCNLPRLAIGGFEVARYRKNISWCSLSIMKYFEIFEIFWSCQVSQKDFTILNLVPTVDLMIYFCLWICCYLRTPTTYFQWNVFPPTNIGYFRIPTILQCSEANIYYFAPESQVSERRQKIGYILAFC